MDLFIQYYFITSATDSFPDKTLGIGLLCGESWEYFGEALACPEGGFFLADSSISGIGVNKSEANKGETDYWIIKIDTEGNKLWDKTFGGDNDDQLFSMLNASDGGYLLGGYSWSGRNGDKSEAKKGLGTDYWLIKIDAQGNMRWDRTLGGNATDQITDMLITDDGYLLASSSLSNISGDKTAATKGDYDFWLIKLYKQNLGQNAHAMDTYTNMLALILGQLESISLYPNPSEDGKLHLRLSEALTEQIVINILD